MKTTLNRIIVDEPVYDFNMQINAFDCIALCLLFNSMRNKTQLIARTKWFNHIKKHTAPNDIDITKLQNGSSEYNVIFDYTYNIRTVVKLSEIDNILHFLNEIDTASIIKELIDVSDLSPVTLCDIVYSAVRFKALLTNLKDMK